MQAIPYECTDRKLLDVIKHFPCTGTVPYSELAMHMKIAGKRVMSYMKDTCYGVIITLENGECYSGLLSELVPMDDRS